MYARINVYKVQELERRPIETQKMVLRGCGKRTCVTGEWKGEWKGKGYKGRQEHCGGEFAKVNFENAVLILNPSHADFKIIEK